MSPVERTLIHSTLLAEAKELPPVPRPDCDQERNQQEWACQQPIYWEHRNESEIRVEKQLLEAA
jgi:hypothetical protein